ncbi:conjugative transfer protein MobI(A/C) [Castellaniella caeni]
MNNDFDGQDQILINDLTFSETTNEIRDILANIRNLIDILQDFSSQHARLIADAIEPAMEIPEEGDIPPLSVLMTENTSSVRLEWQKNEIIRNSSGDMRSVRRRRIQLNGSGKYPKSMFDVIPPSDQKRFQEAEISLSKIRRQYTLIADMRNIIDRYKYALRSIAPVESSTVSDI